MNKLINEARHIPVNDAARTISVSPVTLDAPGREQPLEMRITAPESGSALPVVLVSHGHGPSLYIPSRDGYGPLANFYAEHGFVVIQLTHANSKVAGFDPAAPQAPLFWRERIEEMRLVVDRLEEIEASVPHIAGRLDRDRIAAVGHSLGGQTVAALLGARMSDQKDGTAKDLSLAEPRIRAGVIMAAPGNGGDDYTDLARDTYRAPDTDFSHLTTPALVVVGDSDVSAHLTTRGADWHEDPYRHGPGANALLTLFGGGHGLGGVAGYDAKETDDEDPDRLAAVQRMTWAWLQTTFYPDDPAWPDAARALADKAAGLGRIESK